MGRLPGLWQIGALEVVPMRSRQILLPLALLAACGGLDPEGRGSRTTAALATPAFSPQTRPLITPGDQWEPAIAADAFGHVYILSPVWGGFSGCTSCPDPTLVFQVSADRGLTWSAPRMIAPPGTGQIDAQIAVDPLDGFTVYASWLQNKKSDTIVARSTDFGASWSTAIADHTNAGTDKPILAVRGKDVYVAYDHSQKALVSASHDYGKTWTASQVNLNGKLGVSLAGGAAIDPAGNVFVSWGGYESNGNGGVHLFVAKSSNGGATWSNQQLDFSSSPPDCSSFQCGWAYLGAQIALTADAAGNLFALWNAGSTAKGLERIYFARSTDQGATWSPRAELSNAPASASHAFPAIVAGAAGDVRVAWMDTRQGTLWNVVYRASLDGGATWSAEALLSSYVPGYGYVEAGGFEFPFGDYFELAIDDAGDTQAVWGEGANYQTPGSIWTAHGR